MRYTIPKILIVEDHPALRRGYIRNLTDRGYTDFLEAGDGKTGLELALANLPDIIISDWEMPIMTGSAMARRLKDDERTKYIPIIGIGGFDTESKRRNLDYYISKGEQGSLQKLYGTIDAILKIDTSGM